MSPEFSETGTKRKRSKEEIILLMLSALSIPSILPFGIYRLIQENWLSAAIDLMIVLVMSCMMAFVWVTGKVRAVSMLVTVFYSIGMLAAIHVRGPELVYWTYPTMIAAYFMLRPVEALTINAISLTILIGMLLPQTATPTLLTICVTILLVNLFSYIFSHRTGIQHHELNLEAERDFLTGVGNRRALRRNLQAYFDIDTEHLESSILLLDIDHFKRVNDLFGHAIGDSVLINLCQLLHTRTRASDKIFRYGGEEFVVLAHGAGEKAASRVAEELRSLVAETAILENYPITISIGVAGLKEHKSQDEWLETADKMLYQAKQSGRNLVCIASAPLTKAST